MIAQRDVRVFNAFLVASLVLLLLVIWKNAFLPMQDLPQHLYMAWIANHFDDATGQLSDIYLLRQQFGPYRATYLLQRSFSVFFEPLTSARLIVSLYVLLVALLAWELRRLSDEGAVGWAALLLIPASLHPMYFYG